jgi:isopropylmalate/homocitrate/citramalate synthase
LPAAKAIETSIEATAFAHKNGLEVVFLPADFSRAELKWALDLIEKVGCALCARRARLA